MSIEVHDHDPGWPERAGKLMAELRAALGDVIVDVEHVGSTAVEGLAAKPVIDLMAATADLGAVESREALLAGLGYRRMVTDMRQRLWYRREDPATHLHVVTAAAWPDSLERLLRDHLREHPADRAAYDRLKRDLAATHPDGDTYTRAKTALIQRMVDDARAARGLPPVTVWQE